MLRASILALLIGALIATDLLCYATTLPVSITVQNGMATLQVQSQIIPLGNVGKVTELQFAQYDSTFHEFQIDGTDTTNNFTYNPDYLKRIASWPYYRFQAWMRDLDG